MVEDTRHEKLNSIIDAGHIKVSSVLHDIQKEFDLRRDIIVKPEKMQFTTNGEIGLKIQDTILDGIGINESLTFTNFARNQILNRAGIPVKYAEKLIELGESDLLLENLDKMSARLCGDGLLIRRINNMIKGVLSSAYRRMDASPIFEGFIESALSAGYVPYTGAVTDYRYNVSFILPEIFNPSPNEFIVFGVSLVTSDYGSSALCMELTILRITCLNLSMGTDVMRSIHIGKRFDTTENLIELSNQTHDLDNRAVASAVGDAVKSSINMQSGVKALIENSMIDDKFSLLEEIKKMRLKGFKKEFAESVKNTFEAEVPVELLPVGRNKWRLSNAISMLANGASVSSDVKLDAQKYAHSVLSVPVV